ncbi:YwmB family TATA-box binding protein [Clostridium estertheticum]|uniref:YwmB family TATA-box binding protein n=1 Tax=Clostridium estertheticum TaxID=238834 RepID=A0AA47EG13_9CLOT|nr:YwmB family TATA-box binding protein [Clostridium estertheticum]MBU3156793.1 YwmB family TATA-box binding protein [Clostridium estertheticum]WAG59517.1 YwmB family TATA-box binding protein [Clostridium estertheticum]
MRKKGITLLCIVLSMAIMQINIRLTSAHENLNLFDEILIQTKSKTVEYGLKTCFETQEDSKEICNYLISAIDLDYKKVILTRTENKDSYNVDFSSGNARGYVEALKYKNKSLITINISTVSNENGLVSLKNKISASIGCRGKNVKYFQYLKAKVEKTSKNGGTNNINVINQKIIKILKSYGTENIDTVSLNNGLSTMAYTRKFDEKVINNKLFDFNYAVCSYSSGNYIIIGTPEIITTY